MAHDALAPWAVCATARQQVPRATPENKNEGRTEAVNEGTNAVLKQLLEDGQLAIAADYLDDLEEACLAGALRELKSAGKKPLRMRRVMGYVTSKDELGRNYFCLPKWGNCWSGALPGKKNQEAHVLPWEIYTALSGYPLRSYGDHYRYRVLFKDYPSTALALLDAARVMGPSKKH
jgi:hypothetical protein